MVDTQTMQVTVFEGSTPIGTAVLDALDPPMGVAMGKFNPTPAYVVDHHANVIDGDYAGDRSEILRVERADGVRILSGAVSIHDWSELGERELHLLGIFEPQYKTLFSEHPDFKAYWGKD